MAVCPHCDSELDNASQKDCGSCGKDAHTICADSTGCLCMETKCDSCYKSSSNCDCNAPNPNCDKCDQLEDDCSCLKCGDCGTKAENQSQKACNNCGKDLH